MRDEVNETYREKLELARSLPQKTENVNGKVLLIVLLILLLPVLYYFYIHGLVTYPLKLKYALPGEPCGGSRLDSKSCLWNLECKPDKKPYLGVNYVPPPGAGGKCSF